MNSPMKMRWLRGLIAGLVGSACAAKAAEPAVGDLALPLQPEPGLVGYWKLQGDCRDYSGHNHHGINHGVALEHSEFDGVSAYIEVTNSPAFQFGTGYFAVCAWVYTAKELDDVIGDVFDMYDPRARRGLTLVVNSSGSGYTGQSDDRLVFFGIDNARVGEWEDCGRLSLTSRYVSNSMLVYRGHLYAANTDAESEQEWCHVYRYDGERRWANCGRVGNARTTGVGPMVVHNGELYVVTWTYDWTRVQRGNYAPGRVYRYLGGQQWQDCGQPSDNRTLNTAAIYRGKFYVGGGPETWGVFAQEADGQWKPSNIFAKQGPRRCFPHAMSRFHGKLYTAYPCVYAFDGEQWTYAGLPSKLESTPSLQTHSLAVYEGRLCAGTWPEAKVSQFVGGDEWRELGRVGEDGTEVNALLVYNGKLYGGSIPRAEVCRYDGQPRWTSLRRFYSPSKWQPGRPGIAKTAEVNQRSRVTSLAICQGKLFASIGNCTSSVLDSPVDVRGQVFAIEAGKVVSSDSDMGPGWRHLAAIRQGGELKLYIDGKLAGTSSPFDPADYDVSTERPLRIGFGSTDYFSGKIAQVRLYDRALNENEVAKLAAQKIEER